MEHGFKDKLAESVAFPPGLILFTRSRPVPLMVQVFDTSMRCRYMAHAFADALGCIDVPHPASSKRILASAGPWRVHAVCE